MPDEQLRIAVFIDFDNIEIGIKSTLNKEFDVAAVLEALKERGEVISKVAYGNWKYHGNASRKLSQHAVQMVQRDPTPRGDKNGADINLALDALEMAFTRPHINAYAIVGGDSDFIALVEKLKQYNKTVFVVGGRAFTSIILQRNCKEFISYENLVRQPEPARPAPPQLRRPARRGEALSIEAAIPLLARALKVLTEREHQPLLGLVKSTMLQLDSTFSERDYGSGSFLDFVQKLSGAGYVQLERVGSNYAVKLPEKQPLAEEAEPEAAPAAATERFHEQAGAVAQAARAETEAQAGGGTSPAPEEAREAEGTPPQLQRERPRPSKRARGTASRRTAGRGRRPARAAAAPHDAAQRLPFPGSFPAPQGEPVAPAPAADPVPPADAPVKAFLHVAGVQPAAEQAEHKARRHTPTRRRSKRRSPAGA
jgi:uncharacterized protein (TIGR00288 family)